MFVYLLSNLISTLISEGCWNIGFWN